MAEGKRKELRKWGLRVVRTGVQISRRGKRLQSETLQKDGVCRRRLVRRKDGCEGGIEMQRMVLGEHLHAAGTRAIMSERDG